jgi:hypothetical protein
VKQVDELNPAAIRRTVKAFNKKADDCDGCERKPSICANVIFYHPVSKVGNEMLQSPAIIQGVNDDGTVNLVFFSVAGNVSFRSKVEKGNGAYEWNWPDAIDTEK